MKNPTFPKDKSIIQKLFFNAVKFKPTDDPIIFEVEDNRLKRMCKLTGVDYLEESR